MRADQIIQVAFAADVHPEASDDARKVKALGLPVKVSRGKVPVARFPQPCAARSP